MDRLQEDKEVGRLMPEEVLEVISRWMKENPKAVEDDDPSYLAAIRDAYTRAGFAPWPSPESTG